MSVVLLARHGQATFGLGTYDQLSEQGQAQCRHLAQTLLQRGTTVDRIVCGDLERQRDSADLVAEALGGPPPTIDPDWNEYEHMPLIARAKPAYRKQWRLVADLARTGNPNRRLQEIIDQALELWVSDDPTESETPEVEPFATYASRGAGALERAAARPGTTLVLSSAGTIAAAAAPLMGLAPRAWPSLHRVMVNTGVTKVVRGQRGLSLISFNEHGHLEGAPGVKITYR